MSGVNCVKGLKKIHINISTLSLISNPFIVKVQTRTE